MARTAALAALAAAAAAAVAGQASAQDCGFVDKAWGASYDLSGLTHDRAHQYSGADMSADRNFTYWWNVCNVANPPKPYCVGESPAWQTYETEEACYALGEVPIKQQWAVIGDDPTNGVALTYTGGQACPDGTPRSLTVNMLCKDQEDVFEPLVQEKDCRYFVEIPSILACPLECPVGQANRQICAGHGRCEYDPKAKAPRCLCNRGYFGKDCSLTPSSREREACDGTCGAMVFLLIILIILIGLVSAAWYNTIKKHRGYIGGGVNGDLGAGLIGREVGGASSPTGTGPVGTDKYARRGPDGETEVELNLDD